MIDFPPEHNLVALKVWATDEEYAGWAYYLNEEASYPWGLKRVCLGVEYGRRKARSRLRIVL